MIVDNLNAGQIYYIMVDGYNNANGNFGIRVTALSAPTPANDLACNAFALPTDGTVQSGFSNANATVEAEEHLLTPPDNDCTTSWCETVNEIHNSVWFTFNAPPSGRVEISTCGLADFNSQVALYEASFCDNFSSYNLLAANDDGPISCSTDMDSWMDVGNLNAGQDYFILVDGHDGANAEFGISVKEVIVNSVGYTNLNSIKLSTVPNPNNGDFTVEIENLDENAQLIITDLSGREIYQQSVVANKSLIELKFTGLPQGMYLLNLKIGPNRLIEKVAIQ